MKRASSAAFGRREADLERRGRHLGAHYTPQPIVERIVRAALAPLCAGLGPEEVLRLRVLDPAVGSGRFLIAAREFLAQATGQPERFREAIAARCLYGIDIDPEAVALARQAVSVERGASSVEREEGNAEALARHVVVADSLLADIPGLLGVEAFDAVLTNPPWLSFSGRQAAAISPERRRLLAERFAAFRRWPTAHGAFLELAARLLRPGGRAALVVPHQVCHLPGYEATREAVLATCRFEPPAELLGEDRFPGVVQPAAAVYLRCVPGGPLWGPSERAVEGLDEAILRRMRRHPPAPPHTFRDPGVHTGNSARLLLRDAPAPGLVPVREGRCVRPFALDPPRRWLDPEPQLPPGHYCRIGPFARYAGARILLRQTADRPIAARHAEPAHFRNSVLACHGIPGLDDAVLVGLLNSGLLAFYHRRCHADSGQRAFPQVKVAHLQALPIAREADALRPLVLRLEDLAAGRTKGDMAEAMAALDEQVYRIYGLGEMEARRVAEPFRAAKRRLGTPY